MSEIENVKNGLTYLLDINDLATSVTVTEGGESHTMKLEWF